MNDGAVRPFEVLLVEDNPGDVDLLNEVFRDLDLPTSVTVARDGVEALAILKRDEPAGRPDLVFLDLNIPKKDGREVLATMKGRSDLKHIPVVVLTSSGAERDMREAYRLQANCFVTKPADLDEFLSSVQAMARFWLEVARLPRAR